MKDVALDLDNDRVRLVCKRIIALVHHCEKYKKRFPSIKNVSLAFGIHPWELQKYIDVLITEEIIRRDSDPKKKRFLYINN